ncbi:SigE family RNA polymerase sigma factor [Intrasporangium sp. YIM S08009]|uniref:SigE family RNA polymerase sigma factor n=1 Tax=Intrasporangium zincisolvens TaxID=3080018 RepID=UPI002B05A5FF|nr:SigE family RNA polymerase sigma factor [Intrasporangium sp. YIM S08009]
MHHSEVDAEFSSFVAGHSAGLLRYAHLLTGCRSDAEELLQDTLERVYLSWERVVLVGMPLAYTRRALARNHISRWRRLTRRRATEERTAADRSLRRDDEGFISAPEERDAMWRLLATLPPRQRVVLVLRFYEDLPEREIAAALSVSVGTVKSQLSRGLATLRAQHALADRSLQEELR